MITIENKADCCGCSACREVCPKKAIEMKPDEEGFLYPQINLKVCVNCRLCEKVCPVRNGRPERQRKQQGYVVQHLDGEILKSSTSGGAFGAFSTAVLDAGGVVYGAAYDVHLNVHHICIDRREQLSLLQKSKYVQSSIDTGTFNEIRMILESDRTVCFSGTPCQIEGLLCFLGDKKYDHLLTIDIACHSVPSPMIYRKYLELYGGEDVIQQIDFRNKKYGYDYPTLLIEKKNGKVINNGTEIDPYMRAFMDNISVRQACYFCKFKKLYRESDITVWDCFDIWNYNNNKGASKMLIHSENGSKWFDEIKEYLSYTPVHVYALLKGSKEMIMSCDYNERREDFFKDALLFSSFELFDKYYPIKFKNRANQFARRFFMRIGMYNFIKKTVANITHKYD